MRADALGALQVPIGAAELLDVGRRIGLPLPAAACPRQLAARLSLAIHNAARSRAEAIAARAARRCGRGRPSKDWCGTLAGELAGLFRAATGRSPSTDGAGGAAWVRALLRIVNVQTDDRATREMTAELLSLSDATVSTYLRKAATGTLRRARIFSP
jgi:hypothetical protein